MKKKRLDLVKDYKNIIDYFTKITGYRYDVYNNSVCSDSGNFFFIAKDKKEKFLVIIGNNVGINKFEGKLIFDDFANEKPYSIKISQLNHNNLEILRRVFPHLNPSICGNRNSFGFGDRLGIVTPAHIIAINDKDIFPFLAQQSVRELNKMEKSWQDVIDCTRWGCFESGFKKPYGADADHIKKIRDLGEAVKCGYTMFTLDPSDYIKNEPSRLNKSIIANIYNSISERKHLENKYLGKGLKISDKNYVFDEESLVIASIKYLEAIKHISRCYEYLEKNNKNQFEIEISMDEIPNFVSPLEHIFIVEELKEKSVSFQSLALYYKGDWQKAIDYIGDINEFDINFSQHAIIAKKFGGYRLSLHSGSEKYSVYKTISEKTDNLYHIKTSGTSWLEAIRTISMRNPELYRELHCFAAKKFDVEKNFYHITTDLSKLPRIKDVKDDDLKSFLDFSESRQMLHIAFGSILTKKAEDNKYIFKDKIYDTLFKYEEDHYRMVSDNISNHLKHIGL